MWLVYYECSVSALETSVNGVQAQLTVSVLNSKQFANPKFITLLFFVVVYEELFVWFCVLYNINIMKSYIEWFDYEYNF